MHDTTGKAPPELIAFTNPYQLAADSSYQNTCEFIAALTGLLLLHHFARHNFTYLLIGDSITALTWCTAETASSLIARRASIAFSLVNIHLRATGCETQFVTSKENALYDHLSRLPRTSTLDIDQSKFFDLQQHQRVRNFILATNPKLPITTTAEHLQYLAMLQSYFADTQSKTDTADTASDLILSSSISYRS
jgi:hypothetical protein